MNRLKVLLAAYFVFAMLSAKSQNSTYYFNHLRVENGLTQNTVWCILQDKHGFIWFGTKDGLNRYDGYRFKTFRRDSRRPEATLGNNFIRSLFEDKSGKIWVGTDAGLYIFDPNKEVFTRFKAKTPNGTQITREVNDIKQDKKGNIWIGVNWQGLFEYDIKADALRLYDANGKSANKIRSNSVWSVCIDRDGIIWIGTLGGGLNGYNPKTKRFTTFLLQGVARNDIYKVVEDGTQNLLLGTSNDGVYSFNRVTGESKSYINGGKSLFVRDIASISPNELWLGTESGLYIYNKLNGQLRNYSQHFGDKYSISCNAIYSIFKDRDAGIWIGTYFGGVNYLPAQNSLFEKYYPNGSSNGLSGKAVREFCEDRYGNLWIGTEDFGLNQFNVKTKQFKQFLPKKSNISYHNIHGLLCDGDNLWIGYFTKGIDVMNIRTGSIVKHFSNTNSPNSLSDNNVFSFCKDRVGNIWIGTIYGLNQYDRTTNSIKRIKEVGLKTFIYDIREDHNGIIWFASYGMGVFRYNPRTKEWDNMRNIKNDSTSLVFDKTISLFEDSHNNMWISTEGGGISKYNSVTRKFKNYTSRTGLPNDVVYKTLEDNSGNIWMSTNKGLAMLNPNNDKMRVFTYTSGLLNDQFNYKSGIKTKDGKLYFGSIDGFICFNPAQIVSNKNLPPIVLTGFQLFNNEVEINGEKSPLEQSITLSKKIKLRYWQNTFSFDFAALSYNASEMNQYAYKMENYDKDWTYIKQNRKVTYSNMPPGEYVFRVKGANSDGIWNEDGLSIKVVIKPPFWLSFWAVILYILSGGYAIYYFSKLYKQRLHAKNQGKIDRMKIAKEKAIHQAKIEFFTNIAHEIRTPLSLIKGPFEQIAKTDPSNPDYEDNLKIMDSNINRLLNLTNQLLDFRKVENQNYILNIKSANINNLINEVLIGFKQAIKHKGISLKLDLGGDQTIAMFDYEAITKVVSNLLNNAIKFANSSIEISLKSNFPQEGEFTIIVANDGKAITPEFRQRIFEPFFQIHSDEFKIGTGLGLPLVKHLVELHGGRVFVDPDNQNLTSFVVQLPLQRSNDEIAHYDSTEILENNLVTAEDHEQNEDYSSKPRILVVEDDHSMRTFLVNLLAKQYVVHQATDGADALKVLDQETVDLVISDVMMPNMNGYEFCNHLKNQIDYSHIPVILLTAKTSMQSKIEGLESGADAYIEKPFSTDYLIAQIANLLTNRNIIKESFSKSPHAPYKTIATSKADETFVEKLNGVILKYIGDENFSVDQLADILNMSRSSLHRKIKGISHMTPNDYIRLVKLKKAVELLENGSYRVNEICYIVGFSSPSYFSKCFYKQFGVLPKDFGKQNKT
jgi:ligand-binding sensor domain-containing protein/signal transduction histidine kinase/CheY-like chemotaxis protein